MHIHTELEQLLLKIYLLFSSGKKISKISHKREKSKNTHNLVVLSLFSMFTDIIPTHPFPKFSSY